jgi:hypothetical protein
MVYVLYAAKENHTIVYKQTAFGAEAGAADLWTAAKAKAIEHAKQALALAEKDSPAFRLATRILDKAEALDPAAIPQTRSVQTVGGYPASHTYHPADVALVRAHLTFDEFQQAMIQLPDHELITQSRFAESAKSSGSGGCFIATAASGSADALEVVRLRAFRDAVIRQHVVGRVLVRAYETVAPPIARAIAGRPFARWLIRKMVVRPAVGLVSLIENHGRPGSNSSAV